MAPENEGRGELLGLTELRKQHGGIESMLLFSSEVVEFYKSEILAPEQKKDPVVKDMLKLITPEMTLLLPLTEWMRADLDSIDKHLKSEDFRAFIKDGIGGKGFMQIGKITYDDLMENSATKRVLGKFFSGFWKWPQDMPGYKRLTSAPKNNWEASRNVEYNLVFSLATVIRKYQIINALCKNKKINFQKMNIKDKRKLLFISYVSSLKSVMLALDKVKNGRDPLDVIGIDWVREKRGGIIAEPSAALAPYLEGEKVAKGLPMKMK